MIITLDHKERFCLNCKKQIDHCERTDRGLVDVCPDGHKHDPFLSLTLLDVDEKAWREKPRKAGEKAGKKFWRNYWNRVIESLSD